MSIFLSGCMLTGKLPTSLMHVVIIPLLKCKSKESSRCRQFQANCNWHSSFQGTRAGFAVATRQVPEDCRQPIWFQVSTWDRYDHICTQGNWIFTIILKETGFFYWKLEQDTPVYMYFLDVKTAFDGVNHWTLSKKLLDRNVPLHIVKLFIFWYWEQEFMVRSSNSLSMTFRCSNWIRQGGQLSPLLYNVYSDDLNHHLAPSNRCRVLCRRCLGKFMRMIWCYLHPR